MSRSPSARTLSLACAAGGAVLLLLSLIRCAGLSHAPSRGFAACALVLLFCLAAGLLYGASRSLDLVLRALPFLGLALLLRAACLDHVTDDYVTFLSDWAAFFRENGGWAAVALPKGNYNAPYLYFLAAISYLPVYDLYAIKLFSVLFDVLLAWGGARLITALPVREGGAAARAAAGFCLLLLLPTVVLNGSYWGQCDAIYGALCLHGLASGLSGRPRSSVVLAALAFSCKLQTVFLLPVWAVLWMSQRVRFRDLLLFPATYVLSILPALALGKPLGDVLGVYFGQAAEYSAYLTLNAPSLYALIPYGMEVDTALWSKVGILAAFLLVLGVLGWLLPRRRRLGNEAVMAAAVVFAVGVPLLLPHMHERYFFLADTLTLCWACTRRRYLPLAVLTQIASLGGYHAYLVLRYAFPMGLGALMLLAVLIASLAALAWTAEENG
ncbi:conjugal transfer protein TraL [uncultured Intestinimonas sp.]|uniref:conjugal transfer protein TraL n=1 Tax=uncultured Intestinimonas sp. TaxID=1689265 RepID=UPI0025FAF2BF|nr:conjugal transfer protein TraL [uncultured Intestinimonas sp.]